MSCIVLFGTESGNSEMIAEDIASALGAPAPTDLQDADHSLFTTEALLVIVCSTYGEGELPASAQPFAARLQAERPDLVGVRYAIFGLGDSGYAESYSKGSEYLAWLLDGLGATRVGEYGRHDAAGFEDASETAVQWARNLPAVAIAA